MGEREHRNVPSYATSGTAIPEYCALCGNRLGAVRVVISGKIPPIQLHHECAEAWRDQQKPAPMSDTSNAGWMADA